MTCDGNLSVFQLLCHNDSRWARLLYLEYRQLDQDGIAVEPVRTMTPHELHVEEFKTLRDTIRERGTARVWVFVAGLVAWGALVIATAALATLPVASLLPLLILGAVFEAVFSLHTGVERVGRYIQVFHEEGDGWENAAMAYGRAYKSGGTDPLFAAVFVIATFLNFVPVLIAEPVATEVVVFGAAHLALLHRIFVCRRAAGRQRAADLERFETLKRARPDAASRQERSPTHADSAS